MFILSYFLQAVSTVVDIALTVYIWIVIISSIISFVNPDPYNPIIRILRNLTEPVYEKIRKIIPTQVGYIDLAPFILVLILIFLREFLVSTLNHLAITLG